MLAPALGGWWRLSVLCFLPPAGHWAAASAHLRFRLQVCKLLTSVPRTVPLTGFHKSFPVKGNAHHLFS